MYIIGVDPASERNLGLAVCHIDDFGKLTTILHKTEVLPDFETAGGRLNYTYGIFQKYFDEYEPKILAVELSMGFGKAFVRRNLLENVGVMKLCCFKNGVEVVEIAPKHIKLVVTGSGVAKKNEVIKGVMDYTGIGKPNTDHEADALAAIITYLIDVGTLEEIYPGTKKKKK